MWTVGGEFEEVQPISALGWRIWLDGPSCGVSSSSTVGTGRGGGEEAAAAEERAIHEGWERSL